MVPSKKPGVYPLGIAKTVQGNLGHATEQMKRESAQRMENFIRGVAAG
jgi:hypothetical protein